MQSIEGTSDNEHNMGPFNQSLWNYELPDFNIYQTSRQIQKNSFKKCGGMVTVLPSIGSVEVKSSLGGNQKDVVCPNGHNSFLDGLLAGIGSPVGNICGVGIVCTSLALLFGVGSQELPHTFTVKKVQ